MQQQFLDLLDHLAEWIERNKGVLKSAFVAIRHEGLLFLVVQKAIAYDDNLSDLLTDLDVEIARDERFNLLRVNTLALPLCSRDDIEQFFETADIDCA